MLKRILGALLRAVAVAALVLIPSLLVSNTNADTSQVVALAAVLLAALVFTEYVGKFPSLIDFRDAPPFNRLRFLGLGLLVVAVSLATEAIMQGTIPEMLHRFAPLAHMPLSPVRLLTGLSMADGPDLELIGLLGAMAFAISFALILLGGLFIRMIGWPLNQGAFNVLTNLPLFDPTSGGDVLIRLRRYGALNLMFAFAVPVLLPTALLLVLPAFGGLSVSEPQTLIWCVVLWAYLPTHLALRGFAILRVASLIEEKRRRAYAQDTAPDWQPALL